MFSRRWLGRSISGRVDLSINAVPSPSLKYRELLRSVPLGDDVYGEDPTANAVQEQVARLFGKEAGMIFPTSRMANLAALMLRCSRESAVYLGLNSSIIAYNQTGLSIAGVNYRTYDEQATSLDVDTGAGAYVVENSHALLGDRAARHRQDLETQCRAKSMKLHLDGTRIFSAYYEAKLADSSATLADLVKSYDTVTACFAAGLGCPSGGILLGAKDFVLEAKRKRKLLGGGMRQLGVLLASVSSTLETMDEVLAKQHALSLHLTRELATYPVTIEGKGLVSLIPRTKSACTLHAELVKQGVQTTLAPGGTKLLVSIVPGLSDNDFEQGLQALKLVLGS